MSLPAKKENFINPEEYLQQERQAKEEKSEYNNGEIYAMSGASQPHNLLVGNLIFLLKGQLDDGPCRVYPSDLKVGSSAHQFYFYPDVTVICGEHHFSDDKKDILLNPTVIFEVLSPSTEAYDRGEKFEKYRMLESLQEYVLVSQNRSHVEKYKKNGRFWVLSDENGEEASLSLDSLSIQFSFSQLYKHVELNQ